MENNQTSSSYSGGGVSVGGRMCDCGYTVRMYTSWTKTNPGRRFIRCGGVAGQRCDFFEWVDPNMCARAHAIISGLLVSVNHLDGENRRVEATLVAMEEENKSLTWSILELKAANLALLHKLKLVKIVALVCMMFVALFVL